MDWTVTERKIPGGKLLRIKAQCRDGRLAQIRIEGDFFLYPEEGLAKMEAALVGADPRNGKEISARLSQVMEEGRLQLIGFGINDVAEMLEVMGCSRTDGA